MSHGFCTKSRAPRRIASTATSTLAHAVSTMTGSIGSSDLQPREQVEPFLTRGRIARVIQIDQRRVEIRFGDGGKHRGGRRHGLHLKPLALQEQLKGFENVALIVGEKDARDT